MSSRAHLRRGLPAALLALAGPWVLAACGSSAATSGHRDAHTVELVSADYYVSEYGVRVGVRVRFPEDRTVTGARLVTADGARTVSPYPEDGSDYDAPLRRFHLPAGTRILLEGQVTKGCPAVPDLPVFEVVSRLEGERHVDRYRPDDRSAFVDAFRGWCRRGVSVTGISSGATPAGDYRVSLDFTNPGPPAVDIVSEAFQQAGARWRRSSVMVPAGEQAQLVLHGHGAPECRIVTPWATGHVLVDGVPLPPGAVEDWC